jgi:hypothetical protein
VTVDEAQRIVTELFAAYPEVNTREETFPIYVRYLVDLERKAVDRAIEALIATSTMLPTIAAIRRHVVEEELELPTAAEAWIAVNDRARSDELHDLAKEARELLGGSWAIRTSDTPHATRSQFLRIYDELRERALLDANRRRRSGTRLGSRSGN